MLRKGTQNFLISNSNSLSCLHTNSFQIIHNITRHHQIYPSLPSLLKISLPKRLLPKMFRLTPSFQKNYLPNTLAPNSKHQCAMMIRLNSCDWLPLDTCDLYVDRSSSELSLLKTRKKSRYGNVPSKWRGVSQDTCKACGQEKQRKITFTDP